MPSFWAELSKDFEELFETEIGFDVIIYAGEGPDLKEFHAHSNILCVRSQYFRSAFFNKWAEKKDGKFILKKPNIAPHLFNTILRFIYCGNIELKNLQGPDILNLLIAVDELNIQQLISFFKEYLIEHHAEFLYKNSASILEIASFIDLQNFCLKRICEEPKVLFNSDEFINLSASTLELLLEKDLNMDEIEVWESLLKWCLAQQNIKDDPTEWNEEEITKIKEALHRFIPLIRFYDIGPADFFYKVYCYKDILPPYLINNLLEFQMVPNVKSRIDFLSNPNSRLKLDSILIKSDHISLFSSWVDEENSNKFRFKLLYRSSQDGFDTTSFHRNCDGKGATIWVAKIQGSTQLIGGYNPLDWDGKYNWKNTSESFLFSFIDGNNLNTAKLAYVHHPHHAVYCSNSKGPNMGNLYCPNSNNWIYDNNGKCYPKIGIPPIFVVEDYEVFQVVKKMI